MSIFAALTGGKQSVRAQAPAIAAKLTEAKSQLADVEARYGEAALAAVVDGADANLADAAKQLASARERLATLEAAYQEAQRLDQESVARLQAEMAQTQLKAVSNHLARRERAARALSEAVKTAAQAWRDFIDASNKAQAAKPVGATWPPGALTELGELRQLVSRELWRSGGCDAIGEFERSIPGAVVNPVAPPGQGKSLIEAIREANSHVLRKLTEGLR